MLTENIRILRKNKGMTQEELADQDNSIAITLITDFDSESPYLHYRDLVLSGKQTGYEIYTKEEKFENRNKSQ